MKYASTILNLLVVLAVVMLLSVLSPQVHWEGFAYKYQIYLALGAFAVVVILRRLPRRTKTKSRK